MKEIGLEEMLVEATMTQYFADNGKNSKIKLAVSNPEPVKPVEEAKSYWMCPQDKVKLELDQKC